MAKVLTEISAVSWEHPADRAALQTLRAVPGFDEAVKKIMVFFGERGIRLIFQADAVRVGPDQFPGLHAMMTEVTQTMDWPNPDLYSLRLSSSTMHSSSSIMSYCRAESDSKISKTAPGFLLGLTAS